MQTYYMIVYRPKGSQTWTPWNGAHFWRTKLVSALDEVEDLRDLNPSLEFAVGKVEVA